MWNYNTNYTNISTYQPVQQIQIPTSYAYPKSNINTTQTYKPAKMDAYQIHILCMNCQKMIYVDDIEKHSLTCFKVTDNVFKIEKNVTIQEIHMKLEKLKEALKNQLGQNSIYQTPSEKGKETLYANLIIDYISKITAYKDSSNVDQIKVLKNVLDEIQKVTDNFNGPPGLLIYFERVKILARDKFTEMLRIDQNQLKAWKDKVGPSEIPFSYANNINTTSYQVNSNASSSYGFSNINHVSYTNNSMSNYQPVQSTIPQVIEYKNSYGNSLQSPTKVIYSSSVEPIRQTNDILTINTNMGNLAPKVETVNPNQITSEKVVSESSNNRIPRQQMKLPGVNYRQAPKTNTQQEQHKQPQQMQQIYLTSNQQSQLANLTPNLQTYVTSQNPSIHQIAQSSYQPLDNSSRSPEPAKGLRIPQQKPSSQPTNSNRHLSPSAKITSYSPNNQNIPNTPATDLNIMNSWQWDKISIKQTYDNTKNSSIIKKNIDISNQNQSKSPSKHNSNSPSYDININTMPFYTSTTQQQLVNSSYQPSTTQNYPYLENKHVKSHHAQILPTTASPLTMESLNNPQYQQISAQVNPSLASYSNQIQETNPQSTNPRNTTDNNNIPRFSNPYAFKAGEIKPTKPFFKNPMFIGIDESSEDLASTTANSQKQKDQSVSTPVFNNTPRQSELSQEPRPSNGSMDKDSFKSKLYMKLEMKKKEVEEIAKLVDVYKTKTNTIQNVLNQNFGLDQPRQSLSSERKSLGMDSQKRYMSPNSLSTAGSPGSKQIQSPKGGEFTPLMLHFNYGPQTQETIHMYNNIIAYNNQILGDLDSDIGGKGPASIFSESAETNTQIESNTKDGRGLNEIREIDELISMEAANYNGNSNQDEQSRLFYAKCLALKMRLSSRDLAQHIPIVILYKAAIEKGITPDQWENFIKEAFSHPQQYIDITKIKNKKRGGGFQNKLKELARQKSRLKPSLISNFEIIEE